MPAVKVHHPFQLSNPRLWWFCCTAEPDIFKALIGRQAVTLPSALRIHVHRSDPTACHYPRLWHRSGGQGTEQAGRNGDGWSDVVLIAPLLFGLSHVVVVLFPGWPLRCEGRTGGGIKKWVLRLDRGLNSWTLLYLELFFFFFFTAKRSFVCKKCDLFK